jgi:alpha-ketoglutarate-dependent taurine dioxygenase
MVFNNAFNGKDTLFLGAGNNIRIEGLEDFVTTADIIKEIEEGYGIYKHMWEEGDMVIWDNT